MRDLLYWISLQRSQWLSREKLLAIQARKLGKLLRHAYEKVPFYRELYAGKMVDRSNASASEMLKDLPIVERRRLADTPLAQRTATNIIPSRCLPRRTSGATGEPVTILETKDSAAYWKALYLRRLWAYGVRPGDKILRILPATPASSLSFFSGGILGILGGSDIRFADISKKVKENVTLLIDYKPEVLIAQPSDLLSIIKKCEELDLKITVKVILTTGEVLTHAVRRKIEQTFSARVFDAYSTVELGNMAWECPTHTAYHINIDSVVLELADAKSSGRGKHSGRVVATCLYRFATPVIRYVTGDIVEATDGECSCGRGLPLLSRIEGRIVDCLLTREGDLISPYVVLNALQSIEGIRKFRVIQRQDYIVEIVVSLASGFSERALEEEVDKRLPAVLQGLPYRLQVVDDFSEPLHKKAKLVESLAPR
ncbi:MAG: hypothetical protein RMJ28_06450 [Nitrososphaerota archaeon]|nr:hypothetical protein [Nitrososphaerota archaeon]